MQQFSACYLEAEEEVLAFISYDLFSFGLLSALNGAILKHFVLTLDGTTV